MTSRLMPCWKRAVLVAVTLALGVSPVSAQLAGVRVAFVDGPPVFGCFEPFPEEVPVDVVATVFYGLGLTYASAWLGDSTGLGPNAPALDWGDGSTLPPLIPTGIPFDTVSTPPGAPGPVRAYRGSFSHTFTSLDPSFIRVASSGRNFSTDYAFTGNSVTVQTPSYSIFGGTRMILTNSTEFAVAIPACEGIDTVSDIGLLLLALALGAVGLALLRR